MVKHPVSYLQTVITGNEYLKDQTLKHQTIDPETGFPGLK